MSDYDADTDETLADLGPVPESVLHVQIRRYGDGPPKVALFTESAAKGKAPKLYPAKRISIEDALALGRFLSDPAIVADLTAHAQDDAGGVL